jgi:hypothetical protein
MIATNSPRATVKSMPRRISTVAPPVRSDFRSSLTTIIPFDEPFVTATAGVFKIGTPLSKEFAERTASFDSHHTH